MIEQIYQRIESIIGLLYSRIQSECSVLGNCSFLKNVICTNGTPKVLA